MISRLLLPSAERLVTYSLVRRSRLMRARQIIYSARLASRLPPRLRRWRTTFPEEASTGDTPQRLAKEVVGTSEQPGHPITDTLVEFLRDKEQVLVIDNCEHLAEATARLVDTLLRCV